MCQREKLCTSGRATQGRAVTCTAGPAVSCSLVPFRSEHGKLTLNPHATPVRWPVQNGKPCARVSML